MENHGARFTKEELTILYNAVKNQEQTKEDIKELAIHIVRGIGYERTKWSASIALNIMHVLVHGKLPLNQDSEAGNWQKPFAPMLEFVKGLGYDVDKHMTQAEEDLKERVRTKGKKRTRAVALEVMSEYYKENKSTLPKNISKFRESIVDNLVKGEEVAKAFNVQ